MVTKKFPSFYKRKGRKGKTSYQKEIPRCIFRNGRVHQPPVLDDSPKTEKFLSLAMYYVRGLGKRHWRQLESKLTADKCPINIILHLKISFFKFKFLRMLDPENGKDIIWIFKNFLTLTAQKRYKELFESYVDIGSSTAIIHLDEEKYHDARVLDYFEKCENDMIIPYSAFPPIFYKKDKMHLCDIPIPDINIKETKEIFSHYIMGLQLDKLFVPPPDVLWKVGNQLFNDGCEPSKDFNRAHHYDSAFLLQEFLGGPLQPRQVWLPSKKVKNNNVFWMIVGRQFIRKEKLYPSSDPLVNKERFKDLPHYLRFDISGFGLQYVREYLCIMLEVIEELYPSTNMIIFSEEARSIMNNVTVIMPNNDRKRPVRGIGLGYYEDIKTLCMIAFLKDKKPFSIYGDQGLLVDDGMTPFNAMIDLSTRGFILDYQKIVLSSATASSEKRRVKWAGALISNLGFEIYREYSSKIIQAFFLERHWERKNALLSFSQEFGTFYSKKQKVLLRLYTALYGDEFYKGDTASSFYDTGIMLTPVTMGVKKDYRLSNHRTPFDPTLFEAGYNTPFKKVIVKKYPKGISRQFEQERKKVYEGTPLIDSSIHYYVEPRIVLNGVFTPPNRILPEWAEFLYAMNYSSTTGSFTYGLDERKMNIAIQNYAHAKDPFRALASGGYEILDPWHAPSIPSMEDVEAVKYLSLLEVRSVDYVSRADLPVLMSQHEDPIYFHHDIAGKDKIPKFGTNLRKRRTPWEREEGEDDEFREHIIKKVNAGKMSNIKDLIQENLINVQFDRDDDNHSIESFGDAEAWPEDEIDFGFEDDFIEIL